MACEESSWQKYEPSTIRVELNPKTILIASAGDCENLCKIFTRKQLTARSLRPALQWWPLI
jgi:hypothetical protein